RSAGRSNWWASASSSAAVSLNFMVVYFASFLESAELQAREPKRPGQVWLWCPQPLPPSIAPDGRVHVARVVRLWFHPVSAPLRDWLLSVLPDICLACPERAPTAGPLRHPAVRQMHRLTCGRISRHRERHLRCRIESRKWRRRLHARNSCTPRSAP